MRNFLKNTPLLGNVLVAFVNYFRKPQGFLGSVKYWENRYANGGTSGSGSYGRLALYKAEILNNFVAQHSIKSIVEFGCGDGHQLSLAKYPSYRGLDVSLTALEICRSKFLGDVSKSFFLYDRNYKLDEWAQEELSLSLDVIYHLVENSVYERYMRDLFSSASRFVIIYASDLEGVQKYHERTRNFSLWIEQNIIGWVLDHCIVNPYPYDVANPDNTSQSNFYIYRKVNLR